jgi:hypothetical protein
MTDIINLYPKTSCPCETHKQSYKVPSDGIKSNLSIRGSTLSPYFDYYDRAEFSRQIQPEDKTEHYVLNPKSYANKTAPDFGKIPCQTASSCPAPSWMSWDPRLFSVTRVGYTPLDRPPPAGEVRLKNTYKNGYTYDRAIGFHGYEELEDGDITYYIDKSIENPFFKPVFSEPAQEYSSIFVDPMGSIKPEYNRVALVNTENPTVTTPESYPYCLSFIQDSQSHREDIMALQTRKMNQSKWSARWANSNI